MYDFIFKKSKESDFYISLLFANNYMFLEKIKFSTYMMNVNIISNIFFRLSQIPIISKYLSKSLLILIVYLKKSLFLCISF